GCCGGCSGCFGCAGCYGCYGCAGCYGGATLVPATVTPAPVAPAGKAATVSVQLPADATLYGDGVKADLASETRTFRTPALTQGRDYYYPIKAEVVRNGETISQSRRVIVRAGQTSRVTFGEMTAKDEPARVTVKLPADAKLYVDGVLCPMTSAVRSFETPTLHGGVTYQYTPQAQVVRRR